MNVGVILNNLYNSQLAYLTIANLNQLVSSSKNDATAFIKDVMPLCMTPRFACVNMCEAITFDGILISTDIDTTIFTSKINTGCKRIFYAWDLEWLRNKKDFLYNMKAYRDLDTKLVARSKDHAKIISNYCNRKVDAVVENFNIMEICNELC